MDAGVQRRAVLRDHPGRVARGALLAAGEVPRALQGVPRQPAAAGIVRVTSTQETARVLVLLSTPSVPKYISL